jgi:hypothetical protein
MTKPQVKIVDVSTGEEIIRDATAEEIKRFEKEAADAAEQNAIESDKANAKQALLDRLGLTADEAKLLLG